MQGKSHRPGLYSCRACREPFTVTVGTVYERSKIALHKWLLATYLLSTSRKGMSSKQIERVVGVTYKSAWFMTHRIREAMKADPSASPLGGEGKIVEADETFMGGKDKNKHASKRRGKGHGKEGKQPVFSLVERDGNVRSFHVANVTAKTLRPIVAAHVTKASFLMTDELPLYKAFKTHFADHETVNHFKGEYAHKRNAKIGTAHTNTVEGYFGILKRGVYGVYHSISEQHLHRYLAEFDHRYNMRGASDEERTAVALKGISGKRLTYRQKPNNAQA